MTFTDLFTPGAAAYAQFRPRYPASLFHALAERAPGRGCAWDCATGSGQAAIGLAAHFERVIATDASAAQIAQAEPHPRVEYRVALAESSGLPAHCADIVTVAQALHWLDRDGFFAEARRVLIPGGVVAVWCYTLLSVDPAIDGLLARFTTDTVGPFWPTERELVNTGYRTIDFPFEEVQLPPVAIDQPLTLDGLAGYLRTWSATRRYVEVRGEDPVAPLLGELASHWGEPTRPRRARWPLHVRAGRIQSRGR
jgi:SAM-dependent methyltransferase